MASSKLNIPTELVVEKNKLYPDDSLNNRDYGYVFEDDPSGTFDKSIDVAWKSYAFRELLEIQLLSGSVERIVNNSEDVTWGGYTWTKFSFQPGDHSFGEEGEEQTIKINVSAIDGYIRGVIEDETNHMIGNVVIYRRVHTKYPDSVAFNEAYFEIVEIVDNDEWFTFELGAENFYLRQVPSHVYRRNNCRYNPWQTNTCPYAGSSSCDRTFATCITLGQTLRFGGQPGIPGGEWSV